MQLFYTTNIQGDLAFFDAEESQHIARSLRKSEGARLAWTDGAGHLYQGIVIEAGRQSMKVKIEEKNFRERSRPYHLTLAVAPTKQPDRIEWMLEKAVETGLDRLALIRSARSEHHRLKTERLERIAIAAMKQSLQYNLCEIAAESSLAELLAMPFDYKAIAHCNEPDLPSIVNCLKAEGSICILIGPEGDFTREEVAQARAAGYEEISLGPNRLRTETAALFTVMSTYVAFQGQSEKDKK